MTTNDGTTIGFEVVRLRGETEPHDPFAYLVVHCAARLEPQPWVHPHTLLSGGIGEQQDDGQRVRFFDTARDGRSYRLMQHGRSNGDGVEAFPYCLVMVSDLNNDHERLGTFDIDPEAGGIGTMAIPKRMEGVYGTTQEEYIDHLLDIIGNANESMEALRAQAAGLKTTLYGRLEAAGWLGGVSSGARVTCLESTTDRNEIFGVRFKGTTTRVEHNYMDGDVKVSEQLTFDTDNARPYVLEFRAGQQQDPLEPTDAMQRIVDVLEIITADLDCDGSQLYTHGRRPTGGFVAPDFMEFVGSIAGPDTKEHVA